MTLTAPVARATSSGGALIRPLLAVALVVAACAPVAPVVDGGGVGGGTSNGGGVGGGSTSNGGGAGGGSQTGGGPQTDAGDACLCPATLPGVDALTCQGTTCVIASCTSGFGDCDHDIVNGCEVDLTTTHDDCGACGFSCGAGTCVTPGVCLMAQGVAVTRPVEGNSPMTIDDDTIYWVEGSLGSLGPSSRVRAVKKDGTNLRVLCSNTDLLVPGASATSAFLDTTLVQDRDHLFVSMNAGGFSYFVQLEKAALSSVGCGTTLAGRHAGFFSYPAGGVWVDGAVDAGASAIFGIAPAEVYRLDFTAPTAPVLLATLPGDWAPVAFFRDGTDVYWSSFATPGSPVPAGPPGQRPGVFSIVHLDLSNGRLDSKGPFDPSCAGPSCFDVTQLAVLHDDAGVQTFYAVGTDPSTGERKIHVLDDTGTVTGAISCRSGDPVPQSPIQVLGGSLYLNSGAQPLRYTPGANDAGCVSLFPGNHWPRPLGFVNAMSADARALYYILQDGNLYKQALP